MSTANSLFLEHQPVLEKTLGEPVSISGVAGDFQIFQRVNGHRHSLDDAITGWYAHRISPNVSEFLDLGTGVGTVGLTVLWLLGANAKFTGIEAQDVSFALFDANVRCNGLLQRVTPIHADIREVSLDKKFSLITGSPPYFPTGTGVLPTDSQKAHARFELRGHVGDYARAAKQHLAEDGVFVFCFPFQQKDRCIGLVESEGFAIQTIRDVLPKASKDPLFSLYSAKVARSDEVKRPIIEPHFIVSNEDGTYTDEMLAMQRDRGFGPPGSGRLLIT